MLKTKYDSINFIRTCVLFCGDNYFANDRFVFFLSLLFGICAWRLNYMKLVNIALKNTSVICSFRLSNNYYHISGQKIRGMKFYYFKDE